IDVTRHQLQRNRVEVLGAEAALVDPHTLRLSFCGPGGSEARAGAGGQHDVTAASVVIATGTMPTRDNKIPFDGKRIFVSDDILTMEKLPRTLTVVGAGVIGLEYASIFAALGVRITIIDKRPRLLPF